MKRSRTWRGKAVNAAHLVEEKLAGRVLEVHIQLDGCTVVVIDFDMFQRADVCNKLGWKWKRKHQQIDQHLLVSLLVLR